MQPQPVETQAEEAALFGGLVELIQGGLTDYRSADIYDWYSDLAGSLTAVMLSGLMIAIRRLFGKK